MAINPLIKRVLVDPTPGVTGAGVRLTAALCFASFVAAVVYSRHVEPKSIEERIRKEFFPPGAPAGGK